jgi:Bacterial Ig-like domain (group 1)
MFVIAASAFCEGSPYFEAEIGTRVAPSASRSSVEVVLNSLAAGTLTADAVESATIAVAVVDELGAPLGAVPIQVEVSGSRNFVSPGTGMFTDANGVAILNLTSTRAEAKAITVIANPGDREVALDDHPVVAFIPGTPVRFSVTESSATDVMRTVTVTARDFFDNVVSTRILSAEEGRALLTKVPEH